ncbi:hypothetical protein [Streptomyces sp. PU_AKi4]|uniref:hypothetical protein n=1 Tax=Streptomyces sp. PU_AKi4 TaxID=2800809 RepID=UPI003524BEEB
MPLLQAAATRGLADPEQTGPLLDGWSRFAVRHLLDDTDAPRRGSQTWHLEPRLYDMPWLARFFLGRHRAHDRKRTWSAPPASSSAASTWAAPPPCPSTTSRPRRPSAMPSTPSARPPAPDGCATC